MAKKILTADIEESLSCFHAALEDNANAEKAYELAVLQLADARGHANHRVRQAAKDAKEKMTEGLAEAMVALDEAVITAEQDATECRWVMRKAQGEAEIWRERIRFMRLSMQRDIARNQDVA